MSNDYKGEIISEGISDIVWEDDENFEVIHESIVGQSRWSTHMQTIAKRLSDGKLFAIEWAKPSTENSGVNEFDNDAYEVIEVPVTTYRYERV